VSMLRSPPLTPAGANSPSRVTTPRKIPVSGNTPLRLLPSRSAGLAPWGWVTSSLPASMMTTAMDGSNVARSSNGSARMRRPALRAALMAEVRK